MALIFSFSMENGNESAESSGGFIRLVLEAFNSEFSELELSEQTRQIESLDHFVRKAAHFSIYTVLGALLSSSLLSFDLNIRRAGIFSVIIGALYAVSDEIHQYFVPGRACMIRDMLLDTSGVITGSIILLIIYHLIKRGKTEKTIK